MSPTRDTAAPRNATARAVALLFLALAFAGFTALGVWQVQRLHWKHALIARVDARVHAPAIKAPARMEWPRITAESAEYRRVFVQGHYLQGRETRVQALTELGAGFWILAPLQTADGIVLINRGFVPDGEIATPPPAGEHRIEGLLRIDEPHGRVLRRNDPAADRWYSRDVGAIAKKRDLRDAAPWFLDADAAGPRDAWPRGGMTVVSFRDHHLQYALTWFALALLTAFFAWKVVTSARQLRHHPRHADPASRHD